MADGSSEDGLADNWEELEDSGELDKRLNNFKPLEIKKPEENSTMPASKDFVRNVPMLQEETGRTQFQPTVKILKRQPNSDTQNSNAQRAGGASKPMKTLEQREAEYAEARMRIFGMSASSSSEKDDSPTQESRPARLIQQVEELKMSDNISRQPRGPDGSRGFTVKR